MKKFLILVLFMTLSVFASVQQVQAKWWIFGKSADEVNLNYMYINKASYEDMNGKAVFFKNSLPNNEIAINGKASVKKSKIGAVMVSLDKKETWIKATLSDNGSFEYKFQPDTTKSYDFYLKIIDTTGKTNDIEKTYVQITFSDQDISLLARETLDKLFKAYQSENIQAFMALVSENFVPGSDILDSAVRKDFLLFDYIKIEHFINNISQVSDGKIFISFQYNRSVISTKTGETFTDKGMTELVLKNEGGQLKLYSMKNPLMFGLSDASEIATGSVNQSSDEDMIVVENPSGTIKVLPYNEAIKDIYGDNNDGTVKTVTLNPGHMTPINSTYDFENEEYDNATWMVEYMGTSFHLPGALPVQQLATGTDLNSTAVPTTGYNLTEGEVRGTVGECWAIDYGTRGRVLLKFKNDGFNSSPNPTAVIFDYKYQQ
ncbi:MAG: hypothetical protein PHR82_09975 [Endomicrobiaceae bacterium]|nr:hypothetical protein [Endomicrobiaceae bacterium]